MAHFQQNGLNDEGFEFSSFDNEECVDSSDDSVDEDCSWWSADNMFDSDAEYEHDGDHDNDADDSDCDDADGDGVAVAMEQSLSIQLHARGGVSSLLTTLEQEEEGKMPTNNGHAHGNTSWQPKSLSAIAKCPDSSLTSFDWNTHMLNSSQASQNSATQSNQLQYNCNTQYNRFSVHCNVQSVSISTTLSNSTSVADTPKEQRHTKILMSSSFEEDDAYGYCPLTRSRVYASGAAAVSLDWNCGFRFISSNL